MPALQVNTQQELLFTTLALLKDDKQYWQLKAAVKAGLLKRPAGSTVEQVVRTYLEETGQANYIRNKAFAIKERLWQPNAVDTSNRDSLQQADTCTEVVQHNRHDLGATSTSSELSASQTERVQQTWQRFVVDRLNYLRAQVAVPLASAQRSAEDLQRLMRDLPDDLQLASQRIGAAGSPFISPKGRLLAGNFLYEVGDLCSMVISLLNSESGPSSTAEQAAAAGTSARQVGLDDTLHGWFREERLKAGAAALQNGSIPALRRFLCTGAPHSLRPQLWQAALGLNGRASAWSCAFEDLCGEVEHRELFTDLLVAQDLETVLDSEHFFLFQEELRAMSLAFTRDPTIAPCCAAPPQPRLEGCGRDGVRHGRYPPSGVLPCRGSVLYAAPLCYLYEDAAQCYGMLRAMYCRFWCRLHSFSNACPPASTLPSLAATFLDLVQAIEPEVCEHLERVGGGALALALPWMAGAFVEQLAVEQVLLLWDRIIGFDSLLPLPLLAVALISCRHQVLLGCDTGAEAVEAMSDMSQLKVVPLLQGLLLAAEAAGYLTAGGV
ncbi:hypothetical protein WJX72_001466 [[Myrmecia] bisecta]|uniref:Rab-GAP TBC domain-containing protein n=1 Tax=[Myrmecia] bisecta TaxID=41462 RepID=A0AAW1QPC9_9CHLO